MGKTAARSSKCDSRARGSTWLLITYPAPTKKHSLGGTAPKGILLEAGRQNSPQEETRLRRPDEQRWEAQPQLATEVKIPAQSASHSGVGGSQDGQQGCQRSETCQAPPGSWALTRCTEIMPTSFDFLGPITCRMQYTQGEPLSKKSVRKAL